jgi:hypothetical protein
MMILGMIRITTYLLASGGILSGKDQKQRSRMTHMHCGSLNREIGNATKN